MSKQKLHSIVALFDTPDAILHAASEVAERGYTKFDVHTPYPLHGMDQAMKLKGTLIPFVTLVFGIFGLSFALFFQWYTQGSPLSGFGAEFLNLPRWLERYPFVIGGKPLFSLPAFVPVMFEVTVLLAALSTVAFLLAVFCKLPANGHPLQGTSFMKNVSSHRYGVCIEASDCRFEISEVKKLLLALGGKEIEEIFEPERYKPSAFSHVIFVGFLAATVVGVSFKTYFVYNVMLYLPPWTWMERQEKHNPQNVSHVFADGRSMQKPVEGTVARGFMPYLYAGNPEGAAKSLVNPLAVSEKNLLLGKSKYLIYCAPCHGAFGEGDGTVPLREAGKFLKPPSLHSSKLTKDWSDGRIYHVIMEGQNMMPSYAKQVTEKERWAIIHYLRTLQRAMNAKEADLK